MDDADVGRNWRVIVAKPQARLGGTQPRANAAKFVTLSMEIDLDQRLEDQAVSQQGFVLDLESGCGLA